VPYKVQLRPEGEKGKCQYASQTQSTGSCQKPPNSGIEIRMRAQVRESFERVSPWRYCQHQRRKPNYIDCRLISSQSARRLSTVFTQPSLAVHYGRDVHQTRVTRRVSVAGKRSFCDSLAKSFECSAVSTSQAFLPLGSVCAHVQCSFICLSLSLTATVG